MSDDRLLEYAPTYFDLSTFVNGETKGALQRIVNKKQRKLDGRPDGENRPALKKRKKKP